MGTNSKDQTRARLKAKANEQKTAERARQKKRKQKLTWILIAVAVVVLVGGFCGWRWFQNRGNAPVDQYTAVIEIQDYGTVVVALDAQAAPLTVAHFVELAQAGFYDGLTFHRIKEGFMMQGGDPNAGAAGTAETAATVTGEFSANGWENNHLSHTRGVISMARTSQDMNSASSQFFITQADSTFLDGDYAAFGTVTQGMEVVDKICADAEGWTRDGNYVVTDKSQQPIITSITIE